MSERVPAGGPFRAAAGMHDMLSLEHLIEARRIISSYCGAGEEYCCRITRLIMDSSRLIAKIRLEDLADNEDYKGLDRGILDIKRKLVELYADYIAGALLGYGEDVVVRIESLVELDGAVFYPGEYLRLDPARAISLVLAGLASPGEATSIKIGGLCSKGGRVQEQ